MPLIQCKLGSFDTQVGGETYSFQFDKYGRAVATVVNMVHVQCLVAVEHYVIVDAVPAPPAVEEPETDTVIPASAILAEKATQQPASSSEPAATVTATPAAVPAPEAIVPATTQAAPAGDPPAPTPDDLVAIGGIGETVAKRLNDVGIVSFAQIAGLDEAGIGELDKTLNLRGSIVRNDWVGQAKQLLAEKATQQPAS